MAALVSAAQRRKQRRLRSWWRHEQQSIAAVLATVSHHSYSKVDTANAALRGQKIGTSTEVGPAEFFELFSDDGRPTGGERPAALLEPRPQGEVQRHAGIGYELAQNLDVPVLHMVEQLPDVLQFFATCLPVVAEQVIDVPKISLDRTQQRLGDCLRQPQMADQLVEVPTIMSYSTLRGLVEQNVDIPVQRGGGRSLQGLRPGQGSTARTVEQTVDIPVPHSRGGRAGHGGLQGVSQGQGSTARIVEQTVDVPVPRSGGLQGFLPRQGSTASSSSSHVRAGAVDEPFQGVFRTFPRLKKSAGLGPHSGSELGADFTPWTPAAHAESMAIDDDESEAESESEAEVEEGAVTRFAAGFRPLRVCMRFLEHQMGRPVWECAYGDRCTFAHSWAELHPEASAHERELASYFPD